MKEPYDLREVDLSQRDPELLRLSPTGKVPFLVEGQFALYESGIINDYLAARLKWWHAYPVELEPRMEQKLMMTRWDAVVLPAFRRSLGSADPLQDETLRTELNWMERTVKRFKHDADNMIALHCAPNWVRMNWLREFADLPPLIDHRPALKEWLDLAVLHPSIVATNPDAQTTVERIRRKYGPAEPREEPSEGSVRT